MSPADTAITLDVIKAANAWAAEIGCGTIEYCCATTLEVFAAGMAAERARQAEEPREAQREHHRRLFDLQRQAREAGGRHIISGGSGWRGSFYGAVCATTAGGRANQDSWRCHHHHRDSLAALECALAEVRRLAAGGPYEPCNAGPSCSDDECRRDWARVRRGQQ